MNGTELKRLREGAGLTQRELGIVLVVTERTIGNWEAGRTSIPHIAEMAIRSIPAVIEVSDD